VEIRGGKGEKDLQKKQGDTAESEAPGILAEGNAGFSSTARLLRMLSAVVEQSSDGITLADLEGKLVFVNESWARMHGYDSPGELIGKHLRVFHTSEQMERGVVPFNEIVLDRGFNRGVVEHVRKDGSTFPTAMTTTLVRDDSGKPFAIAGIARDISVEKCAEEAIRQERDRAQNYLDVARVMILALDRGGRINLINRRGCEILGWDEAELIGKNWFDKCLPQEVREPVKRVFERLMAGEIEPVEEYDNPVLTRSGEKRVIHWHNALLRDEAGNITGSLSSGEDVTERMEINDRLELTRFSIDHAPDAVFWIRPDARFAQVNDTACRVLGYSREELLGMSVHDIDPVFTKEKWPGHWEELKKRKQMTIETVHRARDGREFPVEVTINYLEFKGEEYNFAVARDITERKQAEKLQSFFLDVSEAISTTKSLEELLEIIHRKLGSLIDVRNFYVALYDEQSEMYSFPYCVDEADQDEDFAPQQLKRSLTDYVRRTGKPLIVNDEVHRRLKESGVAEMIGTPSKIWLGAPLRTPRGVIGVVVVQSYTDPGLYSREDVALMSFVSEHIAMAIDHKRAEDALRKSETQYKELFESVMEGLGVTDENETIRLCNRAFASIFEETKENLIGRSLLDYLPPAAMETIRSESEKRKQGHASQYEIEIRTSKGNRRTVLASISPWFNEGGKYIGSLGAVVDITDRKRMEAELQKMMKLESVGILAGGIAHDFNNLLTAVIGNISLARTSPDIGEKARRRLLEAEKASLRAQGLTQQLLTFSKGGAPVKKTTSIAETIRDSARFALRGSNVRCEFSIPEDLWAVEADEGQISQVIGNLVINADQAMPEGGVIRLSAENRLVDKHDSLPLAEGRYVKIVVEDEGTGIPPENLSRVFDPYFTTKEEGSGLGLAISYSIIKRHEGHMAVESEPGRGSSFSIYLPAAEARLEPEEAPQPEIAASRGGKVLVMDDEDLVREVLTGMLTHLGHKVAVARDGAEAIRMAKAAAASGRSFDAAIMDLTIPGGMGGKEALGLIRRELPNLKAIVSSGYSNSPVMAEYKRYGFDACIAKPFKVDELQRVLQSVLPPPGKETVPEPATGGHGRTTPLSSPAGR